MAERPLRPDSRFVHAAQEPDPQTGSVVAPIHLATTYAQEAIGRHKGFEYSRSGNPTRQVLEQNIAELEGAERGFAFASGSAATATVAHLLKAGDHLVCEENVYGGTYRFFTRVMGPWGLKVTYVDASDPKNIERALTPQTKLVWLETPTNPNLRLCDIRAVAEVARAKQALVAVDNTFCSPALQQPHALGADLVMHSSTKYLGGHSDVVGGLVTTKRDDLVEPLGFQQNAIGAVPSPFDCWLLLRGIKTLGLRMRQHSRNGQVLAERLQQSPKVKKVYYPGLPEHPQHALAERQMKGMGGMVSFDLGSRAAVDKFVGQLKLVRIAESLGAVESLVCYPATMTHASIPPEQRARSGVTEGLLRVSAGIEDPEDIWDDLARGLAAV
ncbi:MAG TPA: PLP-dependent aspartate aminotransferase family protein [Candidatus Thermoplasmatota archaeon]|jgi:cystathionine gamma-synthase/cystathionine gamma-lyase|nr:PLP-dependent aspartate aminotransferase family protein [Candidatus Thermoplasmatota archaeon]